MMHRTGRGSKSKNEAKTEPRDENMKFDDIPLKYLMGPTFGVLLVAATLLFGERN